MSSQQSRHVGAVWALETSDGGHYVKDGRPVWPLRTAMEREALERMLATMGGHLGLVDHATPGTLSGPGLVVGLGPRAFEDARLYAHLTMRAYQPAHTREELAELPLPSVLVTTLEHVDEDLLDLMYDHRPVDEVPGLIFAFAEDDLRRQVLARAATLHCPPRAARTRRIDLYPLLPVAHVEGPGLTVLGGRATAAQLRGAVAEHANLLTVSTHSDGIDAQLIPELVLCPMDRVPHDHDPALAPSCHTTGYCHRRERPIERALEEGSLLSPSEIAADVMIHCVCWGLYPAPGIQSPAFSLARRLLEELNVGALITTWEIVSQTTSTTSTLFHDVARGVPLGRALARHLAAPESMHKGHRLVLVGDPELRLPPSDEPDPLEGLRNEPSPPVASSGQTGALALLRAMVVEARRTQRPDRSDTSSAAIEAALHYEAAQLAGVPLEEDPTAAGPALRRAMLEYFAHRYTDASRYWLAYASDVRTLAERRPCPACGRRTISRRYALRVPGAAKRDHTHCPTCGPIGDLPEGRALTIAVDPDGTIRLGGDLPQSCWDAQVVLDTQIASMHATWPWPAAADGSPAVLVRPTETWPQVPLRVALLMLREDCELDVVGCLCRVRSRA